MSDDPRHHLRSPHFGKHYPNWLLQLLLGALAVLAALGMAGVIKQSGQAECEAAGGKFIFGHRRFKACVFSEDEQEQ